MKMSEHQYDKRILKSCVDPNPLMVERQGPDNFTRFQARERCALEIAAYVFNDIQCYLPSGYSPLASMWNKVKVCTGHYQKMEEFRKAKS